MSTFIEVESVDKDCKVIINLDQVQEIAPLRDGGCVLFFGDSAAVNGKSAYAVKDNYDQFKQFAMQTVSAADIAARFPKTIKAEPEATKPQTKEKAAKMEIPKL